jgi:hypothetical protein
MTEQSLNFWTWELKLEDQTFVLKKKKKNLGG